MKMPEVFETQQCLFKMFQEIGRNYNSKNIVKSELAKDDKFCVFIGYICFTILS